jgi:hypothetical protein
MKRLLWLLMLVSQPVWAEWVELYGITGATDTHTHHLDPASVRKTENGRRAWVMDSYQQPQTNSLGTFQSTKILREVDCSGGRSRYLQGHAYSGQMGEGSLVHSVTTSGAWSFVVPESGGETSLKAICKLPLK